MAMRRRSQASGEEQGQLPTGDTSPGPEAGAAGKPAAGTGESEGKGGATEDRSSVAGNGKLDSKRDAAAKILENVCMGPGYDRIIEHVFTVAPWESYEQLEEGLKIGEASKADYATVCDALDSAEDNARQAHRLFVAARVTRERFEMDADVILAGMREEATMSLQAEKAKGDRSKAITDADVVARMISLFPDQYRATEEKKLRARKAVEHLEVFAELWKNRPRTLAAIITTMRRG